MGIRAIVQQKLETLRAKKGIGSSLEAKVRIRAPRRVYELLTKYSQVLGEILIVSSVELEEVLDEVVIVIVGHAGGEKCERCWHWREIVVDDPRVKGVCDRCIRQLEEGWGL